MPGASLCPERPRGDGPSRPGQMNLPRAVLRDALYRITSPRVVHALGEPVFWLLGRRGRSRARQRILIVRLDDLGDMVLMSPFLQAVRRAYPAAVIDLAVKPPAVPLASACPLVNTVWEFSPVIMPLWGQVLRLWQTFQFSRRMLWPRGYDLAIVPRWGADFYHAGYLAYFSGARERIGYAHDGVSIIGPARIPDTDVFFTKFLDRGGPAHEVERNLTAARTITGAAEAPSLTVWTTAEDVAAVDAVRQQEGLADADTIIAFAPGAAAAKRRWPVERYAEVGRALADGVRIAILGGAADRVLGDQLVQAIGPQAVNLAGKLELRQTAVFLRQCRLYVGADSGPMHLAAAAGVPIVEISCHPRTGSRDHVNSPARFGPWGVPAKILQPPAATPPCRDGCDADEPHCILQISVGEVIAAANALLTETAHSPVASR